MKELTVREFRSEWTKLTRDVVRVSSRGRLLGHWVPGDSSLHWDDPDVESDPAPQQTLGPAGDPDEDVVLGRLVGEGPPKLTLKEQQRKRDEILKRMSKTK